MSARAGSGARLAVHLLFFLSGAAALVYQIVWMRMLILVFGATAFAVSTVLTAFMGGLALGSFVFGRRVDVGRRPLRLYGLLEIGIGVYAVAVPFLFAALVPLYRWIWNTYEPGLASFSLLKFAGSLALLLVPTTFMGGTLPVLSRWAVHRQARLGTRVGTLYAVNTFGAVVGTFLCGFVLIRFLGVTATILLAAAVNLALGAASLWISARAGETAERWAPQRTAVAAEAVTRPPSRWPLRTVLAVYAVSGFAALLLEVAWTRVLTLVIGGSVYAFTLMLTSFLVGLAGGAAAFAPIADRAGRHRPVLLGALLGAAGMAAMASVWLFGWLPYAFARLFQGAGGDEILTTVTKFALCCLVMFPGTFLLGGVFPVVVRIYSRDLAALGRSVGEAYAANTLGTIAGAFAGGFVFIPLLGLQGTIVAAAMVELVVAVAVVAVLTPVAAARRWAAAAVLLLAVTGAWYLRPRWNTLVMNSGIYLYASDLPAAFSPEEFEEYTETAYRELFYREGATATILVGEEKANGNVFLSVNGKVDASSGSDMQTQVLSAQLPLLLHPNPQEVLIVGLASGVTAGSVLTHDVERVDVVEIEQAVIEASRFFDAYSNAPLDDPRLRPIVNDGRNYLLFTRNGYDIIISEPSNPWLTGAANLFTREYFELVVRRLRAGGIACQWIQAYNMSLPDLRSLLATYVDVFRHVLLFNLDGSDLLLVGSEEPLRFDLDRLRDRAAALDVALDLGRIGIRSVEDLLAWFAFGEREMVRFIADAGLNTDDNARIEFSAPWSLHRETITANTRALEAVAAPPETYVAPAPRSLEERADFYERLASALYRRAAYAAALEAVQRALELRSSDDARELKTAIERRLGG